MGLWDVLEKYGEPGMIWADRTAEESASVKHPDFRDVAGKVADGDASADEGRKRRVHVAQELEMDSIPAHQTGLGHGQ